MLELFSTNELDMMQTYKDLYTEARAGSCDIKHYLREWDSCKRDLFHILGDQMIISKEISFNKSAEQLGIEIYDKILNTDLGQKIFSAVDKAIQQIPYGQGGYRFNWLLECSVLGANSWPYERCRFDLPSGKVLTIEPKCKPMRILAKLAEEFNFMELFEEFRIAHSQILNQKAMKGELCLSIHPMDYMTMSDNDCDWSSCMSWIHSGCYRSGTVEMMNSEHVLVAYLKSASDMSLDGGYTWNSKRWRILVIVDPEYGIISTIKGYPYYSEDLNNAVVQWIADLVEKNNTNVHFNTPVITTGDPYRKQNVHINFQSDRMYNDFGSTTHHILLASHYNAPNYPEVYNYSGVFVCADCGEIDYNHEGECEEYLVCSSCGHYGRIRCEHCGDYYYEDDMRTVDGEQWCEYCFDNNTVYDTLDDESHSADEYELKRIHIIPKELLGKTFTEPREVTRATRYVSITRDFDEYSERIISYYFMPNAATSVFEQDGYYFLSSEYVKNALINRIDSWNNTVEEYNRDTLVNF